jgi:hypothetical protein
LLPEYLIPYRRYPILFIFNVLNIIKTIDKNKSSKSESKKKLGKANLKQSLKS